MLFEKVTQNCLNVITFNFYILGPSAILHRQHAELVQLEGLAEEKKGDGRREKG